MESVMWIFPQMEKQKKINGTPILQVMRYDCKSGAGDCCEIVNVLWYSWTENVNSDGCDCGMDFAWYVWNIVYLILKRLDFLIRKNLGQKSAIYILNWEDTI